MSTPIEITALSSKGQVVIPQSVRKGLDLEPGTKFLVFAEQDGIYLKRVVAPPKDELDSFFNRMQLEAKRVGMSEDDISEAIESERNE